MPYHKYIVPYLTNIACRSSIITSQRQIIIPKAHGHILEIGAGSGSNLPYYNWSQIQSLTLLEPDKRLQAYGRTQSAPPEKISWMLSGAEKIDLPDHVMDSVTVTYALCSIPQIDQALAEIYRILKPGGILLFSEHGVSPAPSVARFQRILSPAWRFCAGGCHLTRDAPSLIRQAGFDIQDLNQHYLPKAPKFIGFNSLGMAVKA